MRISDWSSDVCSSDLHRDHRLRGHRARDATDQPRADLLTAAEAAETGSGAWYGRCCDATLRCAVGATGTGAAPRRRPAAGAGGAGPRNAGVARAYPYTVTAMCTADSLVGLGPP